MVLKKDLRKYRKKRVRRSDGFMTTVYVLRKKNVVKKRKQKFGLGGKTLSKLIGFVPDRSNEELEQELEQARALRREQEQARRQRVQARIAQAQEEARMRAQEEEQRQAWEQEGWQEELMRPGLGRGLYPVDVAREQEFNIDNPIENNINDPRHTDNPHRTIYSYYNNLHT